jgi:UDP-GlcNAc:undecaprenyl-phosphate/decaprenyl-phosphate GlcNAc-1-phosphate transferase
MSVIVVPPLLGLILGVLLTPLAIRAAWATGFLDHPEARKLHTSATALLGGVVVFVCAVLAVELAGFAGVPRWQPPLGVWSGAVLSLAIGVWDDRFGMRPLLKLICQAAAAAMLIGAVHVPEIGLPAPLTFTLVLIVLVALMNAVNFLDNMNGMVGGLTAILLAGFAWGSASRGAYDLACAQLAGAGACAGFLGYNYPRARIFLGDAGSLLLGYSLGASALLAFQGAPQGWGRVGPLLMLAYPAFDMCFVVINRLREGRKIYEGGKDHSNHRLASVLKCQKRTVILLWVVGAALSASGLVVLNLNRALPALLLSGLWMILLLWAGLRLSSVPVVRTSSVLPHPLPAATPSPKT